MNKQQFCKQFNLTEDQFFGKVKIEGYLDLRSVTSIPEGFNPTVGGDLDLRSVTSIPEGFNPTVGGDLEWRTGSRYVGATIPRPKIKQVNKNFFWSKNGSTYAFIDGIFCEVVNDRTSKVNDEDFRIIAAKKVNKPDTFFIVSNVDLYAHGSELAKAFEDLHFKIACEKFKSEPIKADTIITVQHYRIITGACEMGCKDWMERNNIKVGEIKASELLPLLEKTNAYGLERFKELVDF